jgi:hypothetical protein
MGYRNVHGTLFTLFRRQIVTLFTLFRPSLHALGVAWKIEFVTIYVIPALYVYIGNVMESDGSD